MNISVSSRREFLKQSFAAAAAFGSLSCLPGNRAGKKPANVILILADDISAEEICCYGHPDFQTPHLDSLAQNGIFFDTCWATPMCAPSRAELLTGRYAFRTKYYHNAMRPYSREEGEILADHHIVLPKLLQQNGYRTFMGGKWHLGGTHPERINEYGFDEYCEFHEYNRNYPKGQDHYDGYVEGEEGMLPDRCSGYWHPCLVANDKLLDTTEKDYGPDILNDYVIDFSERNRTNPFFIYYPMILAHTQPDYMTGGKECQVPVPVRDENGNWTGQRSPEGLKHNIEYVDYLIGRLVGALEKNGLRENTVIFFTSDNASAFNYKCTPTERGCRVPMIVNCPGQIAATGSCEQMIDFSDVLPTVADLAGVSLPQDYEIDGMSFSHTLMGQPGPQREYVFSYYAYHRMVRDRNWYLDGYGNFYYCGDNRTGRGYEEMTDTTDEKALAAKKRLEQALEHNLPAPDPVRDKKLLDRYQVQWEDIFKKRMKDYWKEHSENH